MTGLELTLLYLVAAVLGVALFRALSMPPMLGYLAVGVVIGPNALALAGDTTGMQHLAEFGVVFLMFSIGLEFSLGQLKAMRSLVFGLGASQVLAVMVAVLLASLVFAYFMPRFWSQPIAAGIAIGGAFAMSSTAIVVKLLAEKIELDSPHGRHIIGVLLFQDLAVVPLLILIPALASHSDDLPRLLALALFKAVVVLAVILLAGGRLLQPWLRIVVRRKSDELFMLNLLLLTLGLAWITEIAGLSMALGAFLAGVLLADSEYRRELETDIEPFKGLLLGLFFIAVGMSIDFGVIAHHPFAMLGLLLGFLAIKAAVIWLLARVTAMAYQERPLFTLLLAQGGEFAFVVFQSGATFGAIAPDHASLLIGAVALSMLMGPLLLVWLDRVLLQRHATLQSAPQAQEISEPQSAPVIIAGFGRYGQIVARMMLAQGVPATVLDHSVEMLEVAHTFGYRVFYGDATRVNLLRMAGAQQARILVVAVDAPEQSLKIVQLAKKHFPHLHIVARARDVTHWHALRDLGVQHVERELFESSLRTARTVLELTGLSQADADALAERFRAHNIALSERMYEHHNDREAMIAVARQGRQQLVEQLAKERQERMAAAGSGLTPDKPQPGKSS